MKLARVSIAGMMCGIVYVAVTMAALTSGSDLWMSLLVTMTLVVLILSIIGAIASPWPRRLFWAGFAVFGWIYWLAIFHPDLQRNIGGALVSTHLLTYFFRVLRPDEYGKQSMAMGAFALINQGGIAVFLLGGHSLLSLLLGVFGGLAALRFAKVGGHPVGDRSGPDLGGS